MFKLDKLESYSADFKFFEEVVLARNRIQHPALEVFLWIAYLYA